MNRRIQITILDGIFCVVFLSLLAVGLFLGSVNSRDNFDNALSNIFDFSAIFSAIIFSFVYTQVESYRSKKSELKRKITDLSYKVTDFRRICKVLLKNRNYWNPDLYDNIRNHYKSLYLFHVLESKKEIQDKELLGQRAHFLDDKGDLMEFDGGKMLYLGLKTIVLEQKGFYENLPLMHDLDDDNVRYPQLLLEKWNQHNVMSYLYTWIDDQKIKSFRFDNISQEDRIKIEEFSRKIDDRKYRNFKFSRELLGEIGSDFAMVYIPKLLELTFLVNQPPNKLTDVLVVFLLILLAFGVLIPLYLTGIFFHDISKVVIILNLCIYTISFSLFLLILFGKRIIYSDLENY
ncbi:MAG: hypothetical protein H6558_15985 [Lewinellaceae bacterium]|nr:hypothetical protein [Lewinellaceae bacterium]